MIDEMTVRTALWDQLPECRTLLLQTEACEEDNARDLAIEPYYGVYSYISEVMTDPYLFPELDADAPDPKILRHCAQAIEQMLSAGSTHISDAVSIRVMQHLLLKAHRWRRFRPLAGPLLTDIARDDAQFFWHQDDPVVP